jgi:hypothetical protein
MVSPVVGIDLGADAPALTAPFRRVRDDDAETVEPVLPVSIGPHVLTCAVSYGLESTVETREVNAVQQGLVVGRKDVVHIRFQLGDANRRLKIEIEVGAREVGVEGRRVEGVSYKEEAMVSVQEAKGVRSMSWSQNDLEGPVPELDGFTVLQEVGHGVGRDGVVGHREPFGQGLPDPSFPDELAYPLV